MAEEALERTLDAACQDLRLCFQIVRQEPYLYVYINREVGAQVDLEAISATIHRTISPLELSGIEYLALYGRVTGTTDPDWEREIALKPYPDAAIDRDSQARDTANSRPNPELAAVPTEETVPESAELDLARYCFVRNKLLLTSEINAAPEPVARSIATFHEFTEAQKELALLHLDGYLKHGASPPLEVLPSELQAWFASILALGENLPRKFGIWMSRYCFDPEKTIAEVTTVLKSADLAPTESAVETHSSVAASAASQAKGSTTVANAPQRRPARIRDYKASRSKPLELLIITFGLAAAVTIIGAIAGWPGEIIHSLVVAQITMTLLFKPFFGGFEGFMTCVVFYITPDWISALQGQYFQDLVHSMRLFFWVVCGAVPALAVYQLLVGS